MKDKDKDKDKVLQYQPTTEHNHEVVLTKHWHLYHWNSITGKWEEFESYPPNCEPETQEPSS